MRHTRNYPPRYHQWAGEHTLREQLGVHKCKVIVQSRISIVKLRRLFRHADSGVKVRCLLSRGCLGPGLAQLGRGAHGSGRALRERQSGAGQGGEVKELHSKRRFENEGRCWSEGPGVGMAGIDLLFLETEGKESAFIQVNFQVFTQSAARPIPPQVNQTFPHLSRRSESRHSCSCKLPANGPLASNPAT